MNPDDELDRLFAAARTPSQDHSRLEFGFETRVLARVREERSASWFSWAWKLCPYFAALAVAVGAWGYLHGDSMPDGESFAASVRTVGRPVLDYYLGADQ